MQQPNTCIGRSTKKTFPRIGQDSLIYGPFSKIKLNKFSIIPPHSKKPTVAFALTEMLNKGLGFVTVVVVGVFYLEDVDMAEVRLFPSF